ncbi:MAG: hypothetical protein MPJ50_16710 [Pirellulales bacterium]|nr:hypothetical protein [Pirellulales bacterium]
MAEKLRIFLSSPGDVGLERDLAQQVVERLQGEFGARVWLETIRWEDRPVRATAAFQPQIIPPSQTDIVVCILWSRLGTPLSTDYQREDGTRYGSGTEWEFEDAVKAHHANGLPDILVYKRDEVPLASLKDSKELEVRRKQFEALESFVQRWFFGDDGSFQAAFKVYSVPDEFERILEADLRRLIEERLPEHIPNSDKPTARWHRGSPYLGLSSFDLQHAPVFFGRTRAISEIRDALVRQAERGCSSLIVFGMSGCGKSSLVRAGVLGTMTRPGVVEGIEHWRWCILRPSDVTDAGLCRGLATAITNETGLPELIRQGVTLESLEAALLEAPKHAVTPIGMALRAIASGDDIPASPSSLDVNARLIIVVDQLEEIFTLEQFDGEQRRLFVRSLEALAQSGLVWVIATMRSDFYPRCLEIPELVRLKDGDGQYDLLPPTFDEVGQMIEFPTRAAGLRFEVDPESGQRLDARLHEAAAQDSQALPLLSFTLDELYRRRSEDGVLTIRAYEKLGGLEGALARRAEEVFAAQQPEVQAVLPSLLRGLVTVDPTVDNIIAARRVVQAELANTPQQQLMLAALIDARLVVTDRSEDGTPVVRVAHEALITHWPRVQEWLNDGRDFLRIRARLDQASDRWRLDERRTDLLLPAGKLLAEAEDALATRRDELSGPVIEFVTASQRRRKRRRVTQYSVTAAVGAIITAGSIWGYNKWQDWQDGLAQAAEREKAADEKSREAELEAMRVEFTDSVSEARLQMIDFVKPEKSKARAIERFKRCVEIAETLAEEAPVDEREKWLGELLGQLMNLSDAYAAVSNAEKMTATLEKRERIIARIPPDEMDRLINTVAYEYSANRSTVLQLQIELAIANHYLKQGIRNARGEPDALTEEDEATYKALIKMATLVAESTRRLEDLAYVAVTNDIYGQALFNVDRIEEAEAHFRISVQIEAERLERQLVEDFDSVSRSASTRNLFQSFADEQEDTANNRVRSLPPLGIDFFADGDIGIFCDGQKLPSLVIDRVIAGGPADESQAVSVGDTILRVAVGDGEWISDDEATEVHEVFSEFFGEPGTLIRIELQDGKTSELKFVTLERKKLWAPFEWQSAKIAIVYQERLQRLGSCLADQEKFDEALGFLRAAQAVNEYLAEEDRTRDYISNASRLSYTIARVLEELGQSQDAHETLIAAADDSARSAGTLAESTLRQGVEARSTAARRLRNLNAPVQAIEQYRLAAELQRRICALAEDPEELTALAELLVATAKIIRQDNELLATKAIPLLQEAQTTLARVCELDPDNSVAYEARNEVFSHLADAQNADDQSTDVLPATLAAGWRDFAISWAEHANSWEDEVAVPALEQIAKLFERLRESDPMVSALENWLVRKEAFLRQPDADLSDLVVDYFNAAAASSRLESHDAALGFIERSYALCQEVHGMEHAPDVVIQVLQRYGKLKQDSGELEIAVQALASAADLQLPESEDEVKSGGSLLGNRLGQIAERLERLDELGAAERVRRHELEMEQRLFAADNSIDNRKRLSITWRTLSELLAKRDNVSAAQEAMSQAYTLAKDGVSFDGGAELRLMALIAGDKLADYLLPKGQFDEVQTIYDEISPLADAMAAEDDNEAWQRNLGVMQHNYAMLEFERNNISSALGHAEKRLAITLPLFEANPDDSNREALSNTYRDLAYLRIFDEDPGGTIEFAKAGLEASSEDVALALYLTYAYLLQDDAESARESFASVRDEQWEEMPALEYLRELSRNLVERQLTAVPEARLAEALGAD